MFEHILNYIKNNNNKKILVFFLEDFSDESLSKLLDFLNKNAFNSKLVNRLIKFENNSNEILVAGRLEDTHGYNIDNVIYYYNINESNNFKFYIKKSLICEFFKIKFNKTITIQKFFKKF